MVMIRLCCVSEIREQIPARASRNGELKMRWDTFFATVTAVCRHASHRAGIRGILPGTQSPYHEADRASSFKAEVQSVCVDKCFHCVRVRGVMLNYRDSFIFSKYPWFKKSHGI
jgi:hypothetical protein